ncbi:MAG TPA: efflux RND transporter periplasmic adaptor subunit [Terriglobia bacterium]|nr:efflux RND transporter periplasmic adaptor subunit [Terriglobia bacterium]
MIDDRYSRRAAAAAVLMGALLAMTGCSHQGGGSADAAEVGKVVNVAVSKVVRADLSQGLRIAAEFRPFQEIDVHAKVAGYVEHIYVDVGDRVKAGQTLAILEVPELKDQLNQAAASMRQREQEVEQAQHELKRAQADYTVAHLSYTRLEGVIKTRPDLVAQQDVDDAQGKDEATEAQVAAANSGLAAAQDHLVEATANRARVQALFDYTKITAPFDGVITWRYADTGAMLAAGTSSEQQALPLVKLSENGLLRLDIPVPEADVPVVRLGKRVNVDVQALNKTFTGTVARFADKVDTATRTMMTEIDVPNSKLELIPGMYAYVDFPITERKNALAVPIQAVSREANKAVAYCVNRDNRIELRPVTVGIETRSQIEVRSGLSEGDRVVVGNTSQLRRGEIVAPKLVQLSEAEGGS